MDNENTKSSTSARLKRKKIIQHKRMNATCIQQKHPETKRRNCTPLADATSFFVNEERCHTELQMKGPHPTLVNEQRDIGGSRRKQQNLLHRFEATVNMVTTTNDFSMATESVQLEVIDELQLSEDNSDSSNSHVEGKNKL